MSSVYTVGNLIAEVRRIGSIPDIQQLYDNDDVAAFMTDSLREVVVPTIEMVRQEFFIASTTITTVDDQELYSIPGSAVGGKIRDLVKTDASGRRTNMIQVTPEESLYNNGQNTFYLQGNKFGIFVNGGVTGGETLRLTFPRRPNSLVSADHYATIATIPTSTTFTVNAVPDVLAGGTTKINVVSGTPPFDLLIEAELPSDLTGVTFTVADTSSLTIGDVVAAQGCTGIPEIPYEAFGLLKQDTAYRILTANSDADANEHRTIASTARELLIQTLTPRVAGESMKAVSRNNIFSNFAGYGHRGNRRWH